MTKENPLHIWSSCKFGLAFGAMAGDEAGYALREEGYNENYACEHPDVVQSGEHKTLSFPEAQNNWELTTVAVLHGIGKFDDPDVINKLQETCGKCPFYERSENKRR